MAMMLKKQKPKALGNGHLRLWPPRPERPRRRLRTFGVQLQEPTALCSSKKPEKDFPPARPVARSPRGGPTMGRPAEWRPELVELADDSVSSTDATIPSSPRGARPMTGSTEAHVYISKVER